MEVAAFGVERDDSRFARRIAEVIDREFESAPALRDGVARTRGREPLQPEEAGWFLGPRRRREGNGKRQEQCSRADCGYRFHVASATSDSEMRILLGDLSRIILTSVKPRFF
jgi:hypothetical protein